MRDMVTIERALLDQIEAQKASLGDADPRLRALRLDAMRRFAEAGLPSRTVEAWRWTDLTPLQTNSAQGAVAGEIEVDPLTGPFAALDAVRLVFANGIFRQDLSDMENLPAGISAGSLRAALQAEPALAQSLGDAEDAPFLTLNTALLNDGACIRVVENMRAEMPLHVIFFNTGGAQVRNLFLLGAGAEISILESHYGPAGAEYFVNQASDVVLQDGARLTHIRDQAESIAASHFHYLSACLGVHAHYEGFTLTRGARLSRNESHMQISGRDAACNLNGAYLLTDRQTADTTTVMDHQAPGCQSRQMIRGVLNGQSRGIFQGLVRVRRAAQQTDAQQQIKALLLSPGATQNSKPELEILADDVKCAHGATVGQLDDEALFYLRSRGIALAQARALLIGAFAEDAVAQIQESPVTNGDQIRTALRGEIDAWLAQQVAANNV